MIITYVVNGNFYFQIGMQVLNVEAQHQNDSIVFFDEMDLVKIRYVCIVILKGIT